MALMLCAGVFNVGATTVVFPQSRVAQASQTKEILVQGGVFDAVLNKPLVGVSVVMEGMRLTLTDEDGRYTVTVPADATLFFYATGYNPYKTQVDYRQIIDVPMSEMVITLGEALVVGQMSRKTIVVDSADMELIGNYLHLKTKFRVPKAMFGDDKRFIVQPKLVNVTQGKEEWFRPVVIDGRDYAFMRNRLAGFEEDEEDVILPYLVEDKLEQTRYVYSYHDSLFVRKDYVDNDYRTECYLSVNGLFENPKKDYLDTTEIGRGTVNPLRFFTYDIAPMELIDSVQLPKPRMDLMSDKGVSHIGFLVGKADIDRNDKSGMAELDSVKNNIERIIADKNCTLKSVSVTGFSSPDGNYDKNLELALKRTELILENVTSSVPEQLKPFVSLEHNSVVVPWSDVADLVEADSLECAGRIRANVEKYGDFARTQWLLRKMPEYRKIIVPKYLPKLRRVEYVIDYTAFRKLTDKEIVQKYKSGGSMTRYDYWRLAEIAPDDAAKEKIERETIGKYPDFTLIANRVAVRLLRSGKADTSVLEPCLKPHTPIEVIFNQTLSCLECGDISEADSLVSMLPLDSRFDYIRAVAAVRCGRFEEAYPFIASKGGLNETLVLMCLGRDNEAFESVKKLLEDPSKCRESKLWYILAACANRIDDLTTAMDALQTAVTLDPKLKELAKLDSDVMDVMSMLEPGD